MTGTPLENIEVGPEVTAGGEPCSAGIGTGGRATPPAVGLSFCSHKISFYTRGDRAGL